MDLVIVGSVAFDSIKTPFGYAERVLGGSATYCSISSSFFCKDVGVVAVVGEDFEEKYFRYFLDRGIDIKGIERKKGKTFFWEGEYTTNFNEALTHKTELNVFKDFNPQLPSEYENCKYLFLANIDPDLQIKVIDKIKNPEFIGLDTMNFWIENKRDSLLKVLERINILFINEGEIKLFTGESNTVLAGKKIIEMGIEKVLIKRGEYGAILMEKDRAFAIPAYLVEKVVDPTGAGDTFAGGFMGYLAATGDFSFENLKNCIISGTVMASFNIEDFSVKKLTSIGFNQISERINKYIDLIKIDTEKILKQN